MKKTINQPKTLETEDLNEQDETKFSLEIAATKFFTNNGTGEW